MNRRQKKKLEKKIAASQDYDSYVAKYEQRKKGLEKQGISMLMTKYTKEEWDIQKKLLIKSGAAGDINKALVDRGTYYRSEKQSEKYRKALKERGIETTRRQVMLGVDNLVENQIGLLLEDIEEVNNTLINEGYTGTQRKSIIGATFFGSN